MLGGRRRLLVAANGVRSSDRACQMGRACPPFREQLWSAGSPAISGRVVVISTICRWRDTRTVVQLKSTELSTRPAPIDRRGSRIPTSSTHGCEGGGRRGVGRQAQGWLARRADIGHCVAGHPRNSQSGEPACKRSPPLVVAMSMRRLAAGVCLTTSKDKSFQPRSRPGIRVRHQILLVNCRRIVESNWRMLQNDIYRV